MIFSEPKTCIVADRAKVKRLGKVELPVYINGLKYNVLFHILPTVNMDVILGMDFLHKHNATLQIGPEETAFSLSRIAVYSQRRFTVPAEADFCWYSNETQC